MDKTEEVKMYVEYMTEHWVKFYTLSKGVKGFKFDPTEDLDKIGECMNNILNSIEFDKNVSDLDVKKFIRDYKLNSILDNGKD